MPPPDVPARLTRLTRLARGFATGLLDLVYPPRCLGCGARPETPALPVCPACLRRLERAGAADVALRLERLPEAAAALDTARALWVFDKRGTLQRLQHALKYGNRPRYGVSLGRLMAAAWAEAPPPSLAGVVPIPLHRTRLLERGYNQSTMLAEGLADALGLPLRPDLLARPRPTRTQTHLDRRQRWANVEGAFATPDAGALAGHAWLVVDDVLTTGSTAGAAARTLKAAGATAVHLATLAIART